MFSHPQHGTRRDLYKSDLNAERSPVASASGRLRGDTSRVRTARRGMGILISADRELA